ncbi:MAG: hypothetical protein HYV90_00460 [Candidatus Woesebacteria bacterium]|nr:MAG: hypothetical protein HYV90_00460 [Candidatus Woesebacteria bacterium]
MKERFKGFKDMGARLEKFVSNVLDLPPSYEEVVANFVHEKNCSKSLPLSKIESDQVIDIRSRNPWGVGINSVVVSQKYVKCDECKASVRFSG